MVPWWKRLILSLIGVLIGASLSGAWIAGQQYLANTHGRYSSTALAATIVIFDTWVVFLSLPGWLLSIPMVLKVRNIEGWRFWVWLAAGACFGPALILAVALYSALRAPSFAGFPGSSMSMVYLAGAISALSSLVYLYLLRAAQSRIKVHEAAPVA